MATLRELTDWLQRRAQGLPEDAQGQIADYVLEAVDWNRRWLEGGHYFQRAKNENDSTGAVGDFQDYELILAAVFADAWARKATPVGKHMIAMLEETPVLTAASVDAIIAYGESNLKDLFDAESDAAIRAVMDNAIKRGESVARITGVLEQSPKYAEVLEGMVGAAKYYGNAYFEEQVVPRLYKAIEAAMETGMHPDSGAFHEVRVALEQRLLKRVPYWHTVSSAATSHAYHYGVVKAGMVAGYRGYRLVAIRDNRTSDICITLDGREFWLADAAPIYDRLADGDDPKDVLPWIEGDERKALTRDQVYDRAVYVPPFHGRCRTTMQLLSY